MYSTVVYEHERGVVYHAGRIVRVIDAGQHRSWRRLAKVVRIDMRPRELVLGGQELLTSDGLGVKISLALTYAVADPALSLTSALDSSQSLYTAVQLALRTTVGRRDSETVFSERDQLGTEIRAACVEIAESLGLRLDRVGVRDLMLPADIRRAFAAAAVAREEARASLERARGETAALRSLANAAKLLGEQPALLRLRTLQTAEQPGTTIVLHLGEEGAVPQLPAAGGSRRTK